MASNFLATDVHWSFMKYNVSKYYQSKNFKNQNTKYMLKRKTWKNKIIYKLYCTDFSQLTSFFAD